MQREQKPFRTFEDLEVYQVAREFRKAMYCLAKQLPDYGFSESELDAILEGATIQRFNDLTIQRLSDPHHVRA